MCINKLSFAIGNIFGAVAVTTLLTACGSNTSMVEDVVSSIESVITTPNTERPTANYGTERPTANYGSIPASRIILGKKSSNGIIKIQASDLPDNVQVLASQVVVDNASNTLQSTNLQTALDTELAVDISTNIVGVWDIKNYGGEAHWASLDGRIEFKSDGTYQLISGGLAVAGKIAHGTEGWYTRPTPGIILNICIMSDITGYEVIEGAVVFKASEGGNGLAVVAKNTADSITMIGSGGCGANQQRITKLTRVKTPTITTPSSLKSTTKAAPKNNPKVVVTALNG
jgi:hypothetical protein